MLVAVVEDLPVDRVVRVRLSAANENMTFTPSVVEYPLFHMVI